MKKTIHIVNSIISAAIIVLGVALIVTESKNITNDIMGTISGGVAATMGLCIMVVGVFFPKDPTEVSDTGKKDGIIFEKADNWQFKIIGRCLFL